MTMIRTIQSEFSAEAARTRNLLELVPEERLEWQPLSVCLRLLGVPLAQVYGPTADAPGMGG